MKKAVWRKASRIITRFTSLFILLIFFGIQPAESQTTGSITGTVKDGSDNPIEGIVVDVFSTDTYESEDAVTGSDGTYTISGLSAGNYVVQASPPEGQNFVAEYYNNVSTYTAATNVSVSAGGTTPNIDFQLGPGATISGTVYESNGTTPIEGIKVYAYSTSSEGSGSATTNASGAYTIMGLPAGDYGLYVWPSEQGKNFLMEDYADPVPVAALGTVSGINFQLDAGAGISGRVTDSSNTGIADMQVIASSGDDYSFADTASDGTYSVVGLAGGNYTVYVYPSEDQNYVREYYNNATSYSAATPVSVSAGGSATEINFKLETGATISGNVKDSNGNPLADAQISAYSSSSMISSYDTSDENGDYTVMGLPAGSFYVQAYPPENQNYIKEYYNNAYYYTGATTVNINAGGSAAGINFQFEIGGIITGMVTDSSGSGIVDIELRALDTNVYPLDWAATSPDGTYTIMGLPPGNIYVKAYTYGEDYISEYYNNALTLDTATQVTVATGQTTGSIDFQLEIGGSVSGHIYETDGVTPIAEASVYAFTEPCLGMMMGEVDPIGYGYTDSTGAYTIDGLPAGNVYVLARPMIFDDTGLAPRYLREWYSNAYSCEEADAVAVTSGADTGGINFNLESAADSDGDQLPDQWEIFYFGDITSSNGDGDNDGDGNRNSMEYMDGTAPIVLDSGETDGTPEIDNNDDDGDGGGGGCFIATAAFGSILEPQVVILREFRDRFLLNNTIGSAFVKLYYTCSPPIANIIADHDSLRFAVRWGLTPIIGLSWAFLNIGPLSTLILIFFVSSGLIGLRWHRRKPHY